MPHASRLCSIEAKPVPDTAASLPYKNDDEYQKFEMNMLHETK